MKTKRLLFLVMAICLASGVKAQFYDEADDIYYYVKYEDGEYKDAVKVFNFDGQKACVWHTTVSSVKSNLKDSPSYYEDKVETTEYELKYTSSNTYQNKINKSEEEEYYKFQFSYDRNTLTFIWHHKAQKFHQGRLPTSIWDMGEMSYYYTEWENYETIYKKVDKSYFKVGRSRTPSNTMHE